MGHFRAPALLIHHNRQHICSLKGTTKTKSKSCCWMFLLLIAARAAWQPGTGTSRTQQGGGHTSTLGSSLYTGGNQPRAPAFIPASQRGQSIVLEQSTSTSAPAIGTGGHPHPGSGTPATRTTGATFTYLPVEHVYSHSGQGQFSAPFSAPYAGGTTGSSYTTGTAAGVESALVSGHQQPPVRPAPARQIQIVRQVSSTAAAGGSSITTAAFAGAAAPSGHAGYTTFVVPPGRSECNAGDVVVPAAPRLLTPRGLSSTETRPHPAVAVYSVSEDHAGGAPGATASSSRPAFPSSTFLAQQWPPLSLSPVVASTGHEVQSSSTTQHVEIDPTLPPSSSHHGLQVDSSVRLGGRAAKADAAARSETSTPSASTGSFVVNDYLHTQQASPKINFLNLLDSSRRQEEERVVQDHANTHPAASCLNAALLSFRDGPPVCNSNSSCTSKRNKQCEQQASHVFTHPQTGRKLFLAGSAFAKCGAWQRNECVKFNLDMSQGEFRTPALTTRVVIPVYDNAVEVGVLFSFLLDGLRFVDAALGGDFFAEDEVEKQEVRDKVFISRTSDCPPGMLDSFADSGASPTTSQCRRREQELFAGGPGSTRSFEKEISIPQALAKELHWLGRRKQDTQYFDEDEEDDFADSEAGEDPAHDSANNFDIEIGAGAALPVVPHPPPVETQGAPSTSRAASSEGINKPKRNYGNTNTPPAVVRYKKGSDLRRRIDKEQEIFEFADELGSVEKDVKRVMADRAAQLLSEEVGQVQELPPDIHIINQGTILGRNGSVSSLPKEEELRRRKIALLRLIGQRGLVAVDPVHGRKLPAGQGAHDQVTLGSAWHIPRGPEIDVPPKTTSNGAAAAAGSTPSSSSGENSNITRLKNLFLPLKPNLLVNCAVGKSRSVTVVLAYLMVVHDYSLRDAFVLVYSKRPLMLPNKGFFQGLQLLERWLVRVTGGMTGRGSRRDDRRDERLMLSGRVLGERTTSGRILCASAEEDSDQQSSEDVGHDDDDQQAGGSKTREDEHKDKQSEDALLDPWIWQPPERAAGWSPLKSTRPRSRNTISMQEYNALKNRKKEQENKNRGGGHRVIYDLECCVC
ncbi:unnamed protein product [Amoebophrya sp. A120]|nr:unnamed protein product [Amoebophrya sp. A120]|eukprot:GSA120T00022598001.1